MAACGGPDEGLREPPVQCPPVPKVYWFDLALAGERVMKLAAEGRDEERAVLALQALAEACVAVTPTLAMPGEKPVYMRNRSHPLRLHGVDLMAV